MHVVLNRIKDDGTVVNLRINGDVFSCNGCVNYERIVNMFSNFDLISLKFFPPKNCIMLKLKPLDYTYCDDISSKLDLFSITLGDVMNYCKITEKNCLCLSESWIPYAWSVIRSKEKFNIEHLTVIHIDDHSDLMSPFISYSNTWQYDLFTKKGVQLSNPNSVKDAIKSGAITIGSMLTPIISSVNNVKILHLKQSFVEKRQFEIMFESIVDDSFYKMVQRFNIRYIPVDVRYGFNNLYMEVSDVSDLFQFVDERSKVILHIDMDYFNNRFNGSTSWKHDIRSSHDPSIDIQRKVIVNLCKKLGELNDLKHIDYVFVGVSPSFYPSEFWRDGLYCLFENLIDNGINVMDIFEFIK